jgi:hypothetical protein
MIFSELMRGGRFNFSVTALGWPVVLQRLTKWLAQVRAVGCVHAHVWVCAHVAVYAACMLRAVCVFLFNFTIIVCSHSIVCIVCVIMWAVCAPQAACTVCTCSAVML